MGWSAMVFLTDSSSRDPKDEDDEEGEGEEEDMDRAAKDRPHRNAAPLFGITVTRDEGRGRKGGGGKWQRKGTLLRVAGRREVAELALAMAKGVSAAIASLLRQHAKRWGFSVFVLWVYVWR